MVNDGERDDRSASLQAASVEGVLLCACYQPIQLPKVDHLLAAFITLSAFPIDGQQVPRRQR